jgi:hypothetical protein
MANNYAENAGTTFGELQDTTTEVKNKFAETANKAKEKVGEVGRNVQEKFDETRVPAADKLQTAASALHERADSLPGGETVTGLAHSAADKMQQTAEYVRSHNAENMMADVEVFVRTDLSGATELPGPPLSPRS